MKLLELEASLWLFGDSGGQKGLQAPRVQPCERVSIFVRHLGRPVCWPKVLPDSRVQRRGGGATMGEPVCARTNTRFPPPPRLCRPDQTKRPKPKWRSRFRRASGRSVSSCQVSGAH